MLSTIMGLDVRLSGAHHNETDYNTISNFPSCNPSEKYSISLIYEYAKPPNYAISVSIIQRLYKELGYKLFVIPLKSFTMKDKGLFSNMFKINLYLACARLF